MVKKLRFTSIANMLNKRAQDCPDHICLYYPDQEKSHTYSTLTYKQFNEATNHLAQKFLMILDKDETDETPIVCLLANSDINYLLTIYALFKLNVIIYPLSIRNSEAAIIHLLEKSNVSHLFYSDEFSSIASNVRIEFGSKVSLHQMKEINVVQLVSYGKSSFESKADIDELDRIRMIFHSSGSTSFPKPIRLSTRYLFGYFESYASEKDNRFWTEDDVILTLLPLFHLAAMGITVITWYAGAAYALPLGVVWPPSPKEILTSIQYPRHTKLCMVPLFLEQLIPLLRKEDNAGFQALARFQFVMVTGAACSPDICNELLRHRVNLIISYGSTEMGFVLICDYETSNEHERQRLRKLKGRESNLKFLPLDPEQHIYELYDMSTDPFLAPDLKTNEFYSPGDLFLEEPPESNYYIIQGRRDDVLVHTTGEKTTPLPIELVIQQCPLVERAVMLGHQRPCCSVLIQLNIEEAFKHELRDIEQQVFAAVQNANKTAPTHSHIGPALIKILPLAKCLPVTHKGNVIRKQVDLEYGSMIEQMYEKFMNVSEVDNGIQHSAQQQIWTRNDICIYLQTTIAHTLNRSVSTFDDYSKSLFSLSLDSVTAMQLRNMLCHKFGQLEHNFIFEFPSINSLADELLRIVHKQQSQTLDDPKHYNETEEIIDKYINLMKMRSNENITAASNLKNIGSSSSNDQDEHIIMITGANGSLGSHILLKLLNKPQVRRIYCLLRGVNAVDRLRHEMQTRKQDTTALLDTSRIIILTADLNDDKLGQTAAMYEQLQHEVTDIIHSAWKMDFNLTIKDFDRESLQGLYCLLKFASNSLSHRPMRFHFISSVGSAGSGLIEEVKEIPLPRLIGIASDLGYCQAKYAAEHICWAAMDLWGVPVDIYRFGQISGDSETGVWNTDEMLSLMICAGGGGMGILPETGRRVDWIPVNYGAACVADIVVDSSTRTAPPSERVHHILHPNAITWSQLLVHLKSCGLKFTVVPTNEWLRQLLANPENPAYILAGFFYKTFGDDKIFTNALYSVEKTIHRTKALVSCPPINQQIVQRYLNYWSEIGFLTNNYTYTS